MSIKAKVKGAVTQASTMKGIPRVLIHVAIGFVVGVIADIILEWLVVSTSETGWGQLETGFSIYYKDPAMTYIPYDDLILLIVTIIALFTKKFWVVIGFFLGWYISSNEGLYGKIVAPFTPEATA